MYPISFITMIDSRRLVNIYAAWSTVLLNFGSSSNYYRVQTPGEKKMTLDLSSYSVGSIKNCYKFFS